MEIREIKSGEDRSAYDEFVRTGGTVEQSFEWAELQCSIPGRPGFVAFAAFEGGEVVASILVIRQVARLGKTWLWAPRGPLLKGESEDFNASSEILQNLFEEVYSFARAEGDVFLRVEPGKLLKNLAEGARDFAEIFDELGALAVKESYLPADTLVLDLQVSEGDILAQMAQKGRYNIKVAEKSGVKIVDGFKNEEEFDRFYSLLKETARRDGFHLHAKAFYKEFLRIGRAYSAYLGDELLATILVTHFGNVATYYFGASSNQHREKMAPYLLQWHAIRKAKAAGVREYDFLGIAPEGDISHSLNGVTQFKTRFGGRRLKFTGARVFVYRKFWWAVIGAVKKLRRCF